MAKLQSNVSKALVSFPITAYHNRVDSITVLCRLANRGEWTTIVRNRVKKIGELTESAVWRFVPTTENPSDLGTRGVAPDKLKTFWLKGPSWLSNESERPGQPGRFLEENGENMSEGEEMTRRLRYLRKCRDNVRKRWLD